ncbi:MAG TPA: hypothetical protein VNA12_01425 [Mycobacteriales bacterium]|nr:hypothetical protein [Mycobacteriales bacterium]
MDTHSMRRSGRTLSAAVGAVLLIGVMPAQAGQVSSPVTITFSYNVDVPFVGNRPESQVSCSLTLPRRSNGIDVIQAAVDQDCINSFSTERDDGREMLHCIDHMCARATNSPGLVPDTRWDVDWTGEKGVFSRSDYSRRGLKAYSASDGDSFECDLFLVN